ncbi:BamA/TamA family outer membrane protein [Cryomorphaceae bacterium 1068]|nr:BamA/TamA family outer membrane protein [Cryomorphaceae bacterium 1068]
MIRRVILFVFLGLLANDVFGQKPDSSSVTFVPLPVIFFTPETRWGFGAFAFTSWRFKDESAESRPSQFQLGGAYTLEDQILAYLPFQLWWKDEEYSVFGELGWYRYNYFFFGIGNDQPQDFDEIYGVEYPRIRLSAMKEVYKDFYVGGRFILDDFTITDLDPEGQLANQTISGNTGGLNTGLGVLFNFDNRDNYFESYKGWYAEFTVDRHGGYIGSDFDYTRLRLDLRKFFELSPKDHLATRFFSESIHGDAPFISQALLGGTRLMRGFYEGRYRDDNSAVVQAEYRRKLFWRIGAVAFAATGAVAPEYGELALNNLKYTYGAGLRFSIDPEDRINIRLDMGLGEEPNFYLTIGESF